MDERDLEAAEYSVEMEAKQSVQHARERVSGAGSDVCRDCGDVIPPARREAAPFADRCIDCQTSSEREGRRYAV